jgi:hypothetical protein
MINLIIAYNHDDSISKLKNMFGENIGRLKWKLPAAFVQWRCFADRLPHSNLREAGNCLQRPSTGSIWRLRLQLIELRSSVLCLSLFVDFFLQVIF